MDNYVKVGAFSHNSSKRSPHSLRLREEPLASAECHAAFDRVVAAKLSTQQILVANLVVGQHHVADLHAHVELIALEAAEAQQIPRTGKQIYFIEIKFLKFVLVTY